MTLREAAQQALDTLDRYEAESTVADALRAALAQPAAPDAQPVAWMICDKDASTAPWPTRLDSDAYHLAKKRPNKYKVMPLYAAAQAAQAAQPAPTPHKIQIPPPPADLTDVCYAEGWNACCDSFFGGKPVLEPLVITIEHEVQAAQPAPQPLTQAQAIALVGDFARCCVYGSDESRIKAGDAIVSALTAAGITAAPTTDKGQG